MKGNEKLKKYCKDHNINAYKLSKLSGVSNTYCYRLLKDEMNNPSISTLNRIALSLGIDIKELI
ncbi:helix-turn-helix domain-containing protein [Clostridium paraputrificum]|uniref:helix-turn-helix domain-containing protein n=1 Tax=Clostridium paraputrificum TaxID=29363 RepID=UPI000DD063C6|nr:helix-turn-helix transcriptional regulator [Clostridium paraputrificum]